MSILVLGGLVDGQPADPEDVVVALETLEAIAVPLGGYIATAATGDPDGGYFLLADGRLIDKTTYATFFSAVGHAYNGGVDPGSNQMRIPDRRGRGGIGADNMGTGQGAAGRLPNSSRARGQNGGAERHQHAVASHLHGLAGHVHETLMQVTIAGPDVRIIAAPFMPNRAGAVSIAGYGVCQVLTVGNLQSTPFGGYGDVQPVEVWHQQTSAPVGSSNTEAAAPATDQVSSLGPYEVSNYLVRVK